MSFRLVTVEDIGVVMVHHTLHVWRLEPDYGARADAVESILNPNPLVDLNARLTGGFFFFTNYSLSNCPYGSSMVK